MTLSLFTCRKYKSFILNASGTSIQYGLSWSLSPISTKIDQSTTSTKICKRSQLKTYWLFNPLEVKSMKFIGLYSKTVKKQTRKNTYFSTETMFKPHGIAPVAFTCVERLDGWIHTPIMKFCETSGSFMEVLWSFHPVLSGSKLPARTIT